MKHENFSCIPNFHVGLGGGGRDGSDSSFFSSFKLPVKFCHREER